MKKIKLLFLLVGFCIFTYSTSFAIDKETLWTKLTYSQNAETEEIARQNLSLVEEIVFLSDMQRFNGGARDNGLQVLRRATITGLMTPTKYFGILLRLFNQATSVAHPTRVEDLKKMITGQLATFGRNVPLTSNFTTFSVLANSLSSDGFVKNQGILNSLNQKISNAQQSFEKKGPNAKQTAVNQVEAAINELNAQSGKGITEDGCQILSGYCKNLITKIQATN